MIYMKTIIKNILLFVFVFSIASCENVEKSADQINDAESNVMGEWSVSAYIDDNAISAPFKLLISDASHEKSDSIIIEETANDFWNFQVKAAVNKKAETFQTQLSSYESNGFDVGVKIANGKIINSDSIYLEIQFEDDETPFGNTYRLKGKRVY